MPFNLDLSCISATEAKLGMPLPLDYVAIMTRMNGGCADIEDEVWWLHPIFDDSDPRRLKRTANDVIRETREASAWTGFPDGAVTIANNGSGDHLIFLPDPAIGRFGAVVYCWRHETAEVVPVVERFELLPWGPA